MIIPWVISHKITTSTSIKTATSTLARCGCLLVLGIAGFTLWASLVSTMKTGRPKATGNPRLL